MVEFRELPPLVWGACCWERCEEELAAAEWTLPLLDGEFSAIGWGRGVVMDTVVVELRFCKSLNRKLSCLLKV